MTAGLLGLVLLGAPVELRVALTTSAQAVSFRGPVCVSGRPEVFDSPRVIASAGGLRANDRALPSGAAFAAVSGDTIAVSWHQEGGAEIARITRGRIAVHLERGKLVVVNLVDLEDYLRGVVALEIGADAPPAALEAQAIAARSFALARRAEGRRPNDDFTVAETQAYRGVSGESEASDRAVRATAGRVLVAGERPVEAVYHHCCGGVTASPRDVWDADLPGLLPILDRPDPGPSALDEAALRQLLSGSSDAWCRADASFRWRLELSASELAERLGPWLRPKVELGRIRDLAVTGRGPSGRAAVLTIRGDTGEAQVRGEAIRWAFGRGVRALRSTLLVVDRQGDRFMLSGGGWGHGVGLCQAGAIAQARAGWSAERILAHYYGGATLR